MIKKEFDQIPIPKLVIRLGILSMLAQFINVLYSVIDRIFVGHIPQVGSLAIAGIGVSAPILTSITAFASLIGIGGASVMSFSMGRKKDKEAEAAIGNSLILLIILSVILTLLLTIFQKTLLYFLGCSDTLYPYAGSYFKIYLLGTPAVLLGLGMNQFVIAQGHSKAGMIAIVFGAVTNTILDPVFISFWNLRRSYCNCNCSMDYRYICFFYSITKKNRNSIKICTTSKRNYSKTSLYWKSSIYGYFA